MTFAFWVSLGGLALLIVLAAVLSSGKGEPRTALGANARAAPRNRVRSASPVTRPVQPPPRRSGIAQLIDLLRALREARAPGAQAAGVSRGSTRPGLTPELEAEVRALIGTGRAIDAVRLVRTRTGAGFREVVALIARLG